MVLRPTNAGTGQPVETSARRSSESLLVVTIQRSTIAVKGCLICSSREGVDSSRCLPTDHRQLHLQSQVLLDLLKAGTRCPGLVWTVWSRRRYRQLGRLRRRGRARAPWSPPRRGVGYRIGAVRNHVELYGADTEGLDKRVRFEVELDQHGWLLHKSFKPAMREPADERAPLPLPCPEPHGVDNDDTLAPERPASPAAGTRATEATTIGGSARAVVVNEGGSRRGTMAEPTTVSRGPTSHSAEVIADHALGPMRRLPGLQRLGISAA